jgi:hypothetical protein
MKYCGTENPLHVKGQVTELLSLSLLTMLETIAQMNRLVIQARLDPNGLDLAQTAAGFDTLALAGQCQGSGGSLLRNICSKGIARSRFRATGFDNPARACQGTIGGLFLAESIGPAYGLLSSYKK